MGLQFLRSLVDIELLLNRLFSPVGKADREELLSPQVGTRSLQVLCEGLRFPFTQADLQRQYA